MEYKKLKQQLITTEILNKIRIICKHNSSFCSIHFYASSNTEFIREILLNYLNAFIGIFKIVFSRKIYNHIDNL